MQNTSNKTSVPAGIYLIADHLDSILASGEDLLELKVDIEGVAKSDGAVAPWERFAELVDNARVFELTIVSRVLQARNRAHELTGVVGKSEPGIRQLLGLFIGGTAALEDAVAELADRAGADFDTGLDPLVYMRTRGMIPADAGTLTGMKELVVREDFLVARRIALGPLLDLTAALLDVLDLVYCLFEEDATRVLEKPIADLDTVTVQAPAQP